MRITDFKKIGKSSKYKVFIDDEFWAILYDETIITYKLNKQEEYEQEFLNAVLMEGEKKLALNGALKLLSLFSKTEKELADYLKIKTYSEDTINYCLQKLKEFNYLNDEFYAKNFINAKKKTKGKKAIEYELKLKGVSDEIIKKTLSEMIENQQDDVLNLARKFIKNKDNDLKLKEKLFRHLASKGFDYDEINFAINEVLKK
ncbi:MAG: regulatory protein RecX [Clostridia bacterium]|nr:regulatory protein RecX [Clostridia bacterium]